MFEINSSVHYKGCPLLRASKFTVLCINFCRHIFKVNKEQLLELYDHVLEIRIWNTKSKLSARAKFDRPKAFRIPVRNPSSKVKGVPSSDPDSKDVPGIIKRQSKFAVVSHDNVRRMRISCPNNSPRPTLSPLAQTTSETVQINIPPEESTKSISKCSF